MQLDLMLSLLYGLQNEKKFIIIGNKNAIHYKEVFPYIKDDKLWVGYTPMSKDLLFDVPKDVEERFLKEGKSCHSSQYGESESGLEADRTKIKRDNNQSRIVWLRNESIKKRIS